jgi:hypothetical protein
MAAYTKSTTLLSDLKLKAQSLHNTTEKNVVGSILTLLDNEFTAIQTAGVGSYTVSDELDTLLIRKLDNYPNNVAVQILEDFVLKLFVEFQAIQTGGLTYTVSTGFANSMIDILSNFPNSEAKINMHFILTDIINELGFVQAADA